MENKTTTDAPSELEKNSFRHKSLRIEDVQTAIGNNYCLWYSPFSQQDALNDFAILKQLGKKPIIAVKEKSDKSNSAGANKPVRLPFICHADRIAQLCLLSEPIQKNRHFYEVTLATFQMPNLPRQ